LGGRRDGGWKKDEGMEGWMNGWKVGGNNKGKLERKKLKETIETTNSKE
jgi:hypothetical protein